MTRIIQKVEASTVPEVVAEALDLDVVETRNSDPMAAVNWERITAVMWVTVQQGKVVTDHL